MTDFDLRKAIHLIAAMQLDVIIAMYSSFYLDASLITCIRYGYVANTKVKFVIVIEAANLVLRDSDIRGVSIPAFSRVVEWVLDLL